jgi:hypothetical protein
MNEGIVFYSVPPVFQSMPHLLVLRFMSFWIQYSLIILVESAEPSSHRMPKDTSLGPRSHPGPICKSEEPFDCRRSSRTFSPDTRIGPALKMRNSSLGVLIRLWAIGYGSIPGTSERLFSSPKRPYRHWGPISLLLNEYPGSLPGSTAVWAWKWPLTSI